MIECVFATGAELVTMNRKDFRTAEEVLGVTVLGPDAFLRKLMEEER